jgi:uncharacterized protein (UPF0335 family)
MSEEETDVMSNDTEEVKATVNEFMSRLNNIENELETLKEDKKELISEFKQKLDVKTLQACLRILKIKRSVEHKGTFDTLMEVLQDPTQ